MAFTLHLDGSISADTIDEFDLLLVRLASSRGHGFRLPPLQLKELDVTRHGGVDRASIQVGTTLTVASTTEASSAEVVPT
ncbi:MAG: hypothetical protein E6R08_00285 [Nevskiaceae bacterium]|nr:MAG: hypothetical protein E6R08_00285 [Nevskiaceae bacterium]